MGTEVVDKPGATDAGSPTAQESAKLAESLRAAQDSAEKSRKEVESLRGMLEERDTQTEEMQNRLAAFEERFTKSDKKPLSAQELAKVLRQQAAAGDKDAIAVTEASREIAREEFQNAHLEQAFQSSLKRQEKFIDQKSKQHGITPEQFQEKIDPYAAAFLDEDPDVRAELAYEKWRKDDSLSEREAKVVAREKELGLFRDDGTQGGEAEKAKGREGEKSWRDAKTPQERRAALDDI